MSSPQFLARKMIDCLFHKLISREKKCALLANAVLFVRSNEFTLKITRRVIDDLAKTNVFSGKAKNNHIVIRFRMFDQLLIQ